MIQTTSITLPRTIGMDLGIKSSSFCVYAPDRTRTEEGAIAMTRDSVAEFLAAQPKSRLVIEACGPCHWVSMVAESIGHEVIVVNTRDFALIARSQKKNDKRDARILGDLGQVSASSLSPVKLRSAAVIPARAGLKARDLLVRTRTKIINFIRSEVRMTGHSLPTCDAASFHRKMRDNEKFRDAIPAEIEPVLLPLLRILEDLADQLAIYDEQLASIAKKDFPITELLRTVTGVGLITSLAYASAIEDPTRFESSYLVGAYFGLTPRQRSSGDKSPELSITKAGDPLVRRMLVGAASYILRDSSEESALKLWGQSLQGRGGQSSRGKARIAVARKLAVILHRIWTTGEPYEAMRGLTD